MPLKLQILLLLLYEKNKKVNDESELKIHLKGLEAKGPFLCLGLQDRIKTAYQKPINFSLTPLVYEILFKQF